MKDQIRIAKATALYAAGLIVILPLFRFLFGTPFNWKDALISAAVVLLGSVLIGVLMIIGSSSPSKKE